MGEQSADRASGWRRSLPSAASRSVGRAGLIRPFAYDRSSATAGSGHTAMAWNRTAVSAGTWVDDMTSEFSE